MENTSNFREDMVRFVFWLFVYALVSNIFIPLSEAISVPNSLTAIAYLLLCGIVIFVLYKKGKLKYYGFRSLHSLNYRKLLFCIPMIIIASVNLWSGIHINDTWIQIILVSVCMLCVGFIEELLFRSFLVKALMNKSEALAIIVSGSIFGFIHLLNIFTGADLFSTLLQVLYAMSFGFMCAIFFCRTNNIIPCVLCHSIGNVFDTFLPAEQSLSMQYFGCGAIIIIAGFYSVYLLKRRK